MGIQPRGTQGTRGIRPLVVGYLEIVILVQQETEMEIKMETELGLVLNDYMQILKEGMNVW